MRAVWVRSDLHKGDTRDRLLWYLHHCNFWRLSYCFCFESTFFSPFTPNCRPLLLVPIVVTPMVTSGTRADSLHAPGRECKGLAPGYHPCYHPAQPPGEVGAGAGLTRTDSRDVKWLRTDVLEGSPTWLAVEPPPPPAHRSTPPLSGAGCMAEIALVNTKAEHLHCYCC